MAHSRLVEFLEQRVLLSSTTDSIGLANEPSALAMALSTSAITNVDNLNRGVNAAYTGSNVYVNWRLLNTDPHQIGFNVMRSVNGATATKVNATPITHTTDFVDPLTNVPAGATLTYQVQKVIGGVSTLEPGTSTVSTSTAANYRTLDIGTSGGMVGIGDLNGDGNLDYVVRTPEGSMDPSSWSTSSSNKRYWLRGFLHDGSNAFNIDLGTNIEGGVWYSPFVVHDLNGDGAAEVIAKTAPLSPNYREGGTGRVISGPEYLTVFSGSGVQLAQTDWLQRDGYKLSTNDTDYNLSSRNQLAIAYLDGQRPSIIMERGTYQRIRVAAWNYNGPNDMTRAWAQDWDSTTETTVTQFTGPWTSNTNFNGGIWNGTGAHDIRSVDLNGDGNDEVVIGSSVLGSDGTGFWTTGQGHVDSVYIGDLQPDRPGLEIRYGLERTRSREGITMVDAATGNQLWRLETSSVDIHSEGLVSDIDASRPGAESWGREKNNANSYLLDAYGQPMSKGAFYDNAHQYEAVYWDNDAQREIIVRNHIADYRSSGVTLKSDTSFATGASGWTIASDNGQATAATRTNPNVLVIRQSQNSEWRFTQDAATAVQAGERYFASGKLRHFAGDTVHLRAVGYNAAGQVVSTDLLNGALSTGVTPDTTTLAGGFTVPTGVTSVRMRWLGHRALNLGEATGTYLTNATLVQEPDSTRYKNTVQGDIIGTADLYGDWREEIITTYGNELRIYSTTTVGAARRVTLMQDPIYRADVTQLSSGYRQIPTTSYSLAHTPSPGPLDFSMQLNGAVVDLGEPTPYGSQDVDPVNYHARSDGSAATLVGNAWKKFDFGNYTVTPNTTLQFTVDGTNNGEVIGVALDNDNDPLNNQRTFRVGGSQTSSAGFASPTLSPAYVAGSGPITYTVNVASTISSMSGLSVRYLGLVVDQDVANPQANLTFSNIKLFENVGLTAKVNGSTVNLGTPASYGSLDSSNAAVGVLPGGTVRIGANAAKRWALNYNVTANTHLMFTVKSDDVGQLIAVELDPDSNPTVSRNGFRFAGSQVAQSNWDQFSWRRPDYTEGSGEKTYVIPVGSYFTGAVNNLGLIARDTLDNSGWAEFSNIQLLEYSPLAVEVNGTTQYLGQAQAYSTQDSSISQLKIDNNGRSAQLWNNAWKRWGFNYTATSQTMLEVKVNSNDVGEIVGISLDNDTSPNNTPKRAFTFHDGEPASSNTANWSYKMTPAYVAGSGTRTFVINIGAYLNGSFNITNLGLFADDDGNGSGNVTFSDIRIYEGGA
ncbi:MAG TPA: hypothetical protein VGN72_14970 [Tepidisphaeraceae bacterium]|jgi:hypothetical protein|nr:hypothetical protein [Tepidisphaeraceae bacterium]